ncbi:MAG: helix-turn-helix domain-containing protein [Pseudomonadota bacterium]
MSDPTSNAVLEAYRAEAARLLAAGVGGKAGRLAELFAYLAERGPNSPSATQAEIAAAVFGQTQTDADDATVRVYVHRLRKKLDDHYRDHPPAPGAPVLEIPAGIYALQLAANSMVPAVQNAAPQAEAPQAFPRKLLAFAVAGLLVAFVAGWWLSGREHSAPNDLWAPLLASERPVLLVLGDYYLFGEIDPVIPENGRLIRDFRVNSAEDLLRLQGSEPEKYGSAEDVGLNYLPFQSAYALQHVAPLLSGEGKAVEVVPASDVTAEMLATHDVVYVGLLSGLGLLEDIVFGASSSLRVGETYDEIHDKRSEQRWISDEAMRIAAPVFYRDYAYVARFHATGGALVTVVASERVTGLRGIGPIVSARHLPDELANVAGGDGFEALIQFTGQQGADLSEQLVLVRERR